MHTIHTSLGFRLIVPAETTPNPTAAATAESASDVDIDDGASETPTAVDAEEEAGTVEGQLLPGWNARGEDSYVFEYRHAQSAMTFRVRVGRMVGRVQIDAMAEAGHGPKHLTIGSA